MTRKILAAVINPTLGIAGVLPDAPLNVAYSATLRITSGVSGPYKLTLVQGVLPAGLSYQNNGDGTGTISGTPTTAGRVSLRFRAQDVRRSPVEKVFQLRVIALPLTLTGTITGSDVGDAFAGSVSASGGVLPYTYSLTGDVPPGLGINPSTGAATGTATTAGSYAFSARVTDADGTTATVPQSITIAEPVLTYPELILSLEPTIYLRLDETVGATTFVDSSGNGFNGTLVGTVTAGAAGIVADSAAGVAFNGTGNINVAHNAAFNSQTFTLVFWQLRTGNSSGRQYVCRDTTDRNFQCRTQSVGRGEAYLIAGSGASDFFTFGGPAGASGIDLADGEPHMIAMVCDNAGGTFSLYIDAVLDQTTPKTVTLEEGTSTFQLGARGTGSRLADGTVLDEVSYFAGQALSPTQLSAIYAKGSGA